MRYLLLGMMASACGGVGSATMAARHAEADLACPFDRIESYRSVHGTMIAHGCGRWAEYSCVSVFDRYNGERQTTCNRIAVH